MHNMFTNALLFLLF